MEIRHHVGEKFPLLPVERIRDVLAAYCAYRWPAGRRKAVAREWGLNEDEARSVCAGRASITTIEKVLLHPTNGRWALALPLLGALFDETAEDYLTKQRKRHVELARRSSSLVRDLRAGDPVRSFNPRSVAADLDRRRDSGRG